MKNRDVFKTLRWSVCEKKLMAFNRYLFLENASFYVWQGSEDAFGEKTYAITTSGIKVDMAKVEVEMHPSLTLKIQ